MIKSVYLIGSLLVFILINSSNIKYVIPSDGNNIIQDIEDKATSLSNTVENGSKIFVIYDASKTTQSWYGPMQVWMNYYNNNLVIDYKYNNTFVLDYSNEQLKDNVIKEIFTNNYLYIVNSNDSINSLLGDFLQTKDTIEDNSIFLINYDEMRLIRIR